MAHWAKPLDGNRLVTAEISASPPPPHSYVQTAHLIVEKAERLPARSQADFISRANPQPSPIGLLGE